ncbi:MAG: hypothetical protein ACOCQ5_03075 [Halanaerobiales bacterium]
MEPYVKAKDLYQFKLALILGRGKRLKKILKKYPTERKFKKASLEELAEVMDIKNLSSGILRKLKKLDTTYDRLVTFKSCSNWSRLPRAKKIMGIDTEYLKSDLDSIQYVILEDMKLTASGFIFTNNDLAPSLSKKEGISYLRNIINKEQPELFVGHNFNSDISILESAFGDPLPELYYYDDTMDLLEKSQLANIVGGFSLNKVIESIFNDKIAGLFEAYNDMQLFIEYGIKDALYPILLREYIINGELPEIDFDLKVKNIFKKENRALLEKDKFPLFF